MEKRKKTTRFNGYEIYETFDRHMPNGGVFVSPIGILDRYLNIYGELKYRATEGWFDSVEHAMRVSEPNPLYLGGE